MLTVDKELWLNSANELEYYGSSRLVLATILNFQTQGGVTLERMVYEGDFVPWEDFPRVKDVMIGSITKSNKGITVLVILEEKDPRIPRDVKVYEEGSGKYVSLADAKFRQSHKVPGRVYFARLWGLPWADKRVDLEVSLELPTT